MDLAEALYWTNRIKNAHSMVEVERIREDLATEKDRCDAQILSLLQHEQDEGSQSTSSEKRRGRPVTDQCRRR